MPKAKLLAPLAYKADKSNAWVLTVAHGRSGPAAVVDESCNALFTTKIREGNNGNLG